MKEKLVTYLQEFIAENSWDEENVPEQARAIFTTLCFAGGVDPDTKEADYILQMIYQSVTEKIIPYEEFQNFMLELVV
ncbi:hypothetical protein FYJ38_16940 [Clostridium sp. WB02_MRS01]|uniref:hypothetical protein n=1 Tax=Clostridium sp. WB02_MRS01 TaxID=2605777 RepID=UPI0012B3092D|nr:hypothetical protein [Clostridium sp. WB02_MRS01]MSS10322.1 hypothetical protein [Clostridium sp. WB02_MRS01]